MKSKHFAVLSICVGFVAILAVAIACCFCIGADIASAEVVGDIVAGNYFITSPSTIYYNNYSYDRTLTRKSFVFQDSNSNATSSISIGWFQSTNSYVAFYYDSSSPSYGSKRVYITNGNIRFDTYNGSSWSTLYSSCFNTTSVDLPDNWGIPAYQSNNGDVYRVLASVLTLDSPPTFNVNDKYMKNSDFHYGSDWTLTFSADVYLYNNVDYRNWVGAGYDVNGYYVHTQNASIDVTYTDDTSIEFLWFRDSESMEREVVTLYKTGTFTYETWTGAVRVTVDTGRYDFSQLVFVPLSNNFGLTGTDLSQLLYVLTDWRDFLSLFGTTVVAHQIEYPIFENGNTTFGQLNVTTTGLTVLDDGDLWNWVYSQYDPEHYRTVCTANFDDGTIYTSRNSVLEIRDFPYQAVEVDGIAFCFNYVQSWEVVKYIYRLSFVSFVDDEEVVTNLSTLEFRSLSLGHIWYSNYNEYSVYHERVNEYRQSVETFYDTNSLPAMMFAVPKVITTMLIGDWDVSSQTYTGGLFSFNILGTDLRVFFLSIVSIIILLKLVSFIIGRFV